MVTQPKISEIVEQLTKLAKLHADGALTDEEFIAAKTRLLKSRGNRAVRKNPLDHSGFNRAFRSADAAVADKTAVGKPLIVGLLIAVNAVIFVLMFLENPSAEWNAAFLLRWGADYGPLTLNGQIWRLFTSTFLHFNFIHIAGNMGCLFYWGSVTERALGSRLFLLVYLLCGLLASLTSVVTNPQVVSGGASGSIAGLLGVMCVMWFRGDARVATKDVLGNLAINALLSFVAGVDWVAHVGGLISGSVLGILLLSKNEIAAHTHR
jgi:membrane associated rhomboid family serine protease